MFRRFFIEILLFLLPFALYAVYLALRRINPFTGKSWRWKELLWLSLAGFILSVVVFGTLADMAGTQLSGRGNVQAPVK
ncbi:MAG: DUF6111 family protein [Pseudomonadota bacterium]